LEDNTVQHAFAKAASAIVFTFAGLSWSEIAALLAACYTSLLIIDWFWVRLWRPMLEAKGWIRKKHIRVTHTTYVETDSAPLT